LYGLELLDSPYEAEFDEIARVASKICDAPIATESPTDSLRQWFKVKLGLQGRETAKGFCFFCHAVFGAGMPLVTGG
jgi:hypothetical protein